MSFQDSVFLLSLGGIALLLVLINIILLWYSHRANKRIDILLEKGKIKDFKDAILSQEKKNSDLAKKIKEAFERIKDLEDLSQKTFQKIGVVRFNPFGDIGGNQSFVIALLDKNNNGIVISSMFANEGNRVYAKSIKKGNSEHALSEEEVEAIKMAIDSK